MPRAGFRAPEQRLPVLESTPNIIEATQILPPLLDSQAPPFKKALNWLQFAYTTDRTQANVAPSSTVHVQSVVLEEDPLYPAIWLHVIHSYPRDYTTISSMISPTNLRRRSEVSNLY